MSSILTNNGAMVALQTLRGINANLEKTQNSIATGKDVASSSDNAAVWAISKVMESDVAGFKAISDNLGLGRATTQVARGAAETTTDLLKDMKEKIVAAQESNVDRQKIQTDIEALRDQIQSVAGAAQFNGLNLLNNQDVTADSGTVNVLSSLDRSTTGVATANIEVGKRDLTTTAANYTAAGSANERTGQMNALTATSAGASVAAFTVTAGSLTTAGTMFEINGIAGQTLTNAIVVSVNDGDTVDDVRNKLVTAMNFAADTLGIDGTFSASGTVAGQIDFVSDMSDGTPAAITLTTGDLNFVTGTTATSGGSVGGGLSLLQSFDVTTNEGAAAALGAIEGLIQTSIDAAAAFGSTESRIETQQNFVSNLMDALKSGIGTLVDADMEAQSARLQALQVQQQLGVQALSIANQAPQQLLSLFR
jgi:flagellin